jgi:hypothetical protein
MIPTEAIFEAIWGEKLWKSSGNRKMAVKNKLLKWCIHQRKLEHYQLHEPNAFGELIG